VLVHEELDPANDILLASVDALPTRFAKMRIQSDKPGLSAVYTLFFQGHQGRQQSMDIVPTNCIRIALASANSCFHD
jgi:hypothetical protein